MIPEYHSLAPLTIDQVLALGFVEQPRLLEAFGQSFVLEPDKVRLIYRNEGWDLLANMTLHLCRVKNITQIYTAMLVLNEFDTDLTDTRCNWDNAFGMAGYWLGEKDALILQQEHNTGEHTEAKYVEIRDRFERLVMSPFPSDAFSLGYSEGFDHIAMIGYYSQMKKAFTLTGWPDDYDKMNEEQEKEFMAYVRVCQDKLMAIAADE